MFRVLTAVAFGIAAVAAQADPATPSAPTSTATVTPPVKAKKICRSEASTGSIMARRTCHTQAEWDALSQTNRGTLDDMRDQQERQQMTQGASNR